MSNAHLQVQMLGSFSVSAENATLDDSGNRSRKVWLLLAYLIYHRRRTLSQEELVELLWGEENDSANPLGALKTTLHRARTTLDQLFPSAGHDLIVRKNGTYAWNSEFSTELDVEVFEDLCRKGSEEPAEDARLNIYMEALSLYQGDFLFKLSAEPWVVPIAAYYHNLYIHTALSTLPLLEIRGRLRDAVSLCRAAIQVEPYSEELYQHLMRNLLGLVTKKVL